MFKQKKLNVAIALVVAMSSSVAFAAVTDDTDVISPGKGSTIVSQSPVIWFPYDATKDGYLIDVVEVDDVANPTKCGTGVGTYWVSPTTTGVDCSHSTPPSDADVTTQDALCTWTVPSVLVDKKSYGVNVSPIRMGAGTALYGLTDSAARITANCIGTNSAADKAYQTFKVDTASGGSGDSATAPPVVVTITSPAVDAVSGDSTTCIDATGATASSGDCAIQFTAPNTPGATWYKVWVNDKNGVHVGDDTISNDGSNGSYSGGWFKLSSGAAANEETIACTVDLGTDVRTCTLNLDSDSDGFDALPSVGSDYVIWVNAWNDKGLSGWSASLKFKK